MPNVAVTNIIQLLHTVLTASCAISMDSESPSNSAFAFNSALPYTSIASTHSALGRVWMHMHCAEREESRMLQV